MSAAFPTLLAGAIVLLTAIYLLGFGILAAAAPSRASAYLRGFASSARLHAVELLVRLAAGLALVGYAPHMRLGGAFRAFGWIIVVTTLVLAVLPWRWHRRFAEKSVPAALRFLPLIAVASIAGGAFLLWAVAAAR